MHQPSSLRWRLLWNLALLLVLLMLASGMSAYWNGREAADTAYDRTLLASARTIAAGLTQVDGTLSANVPYVALETFAYDSAGVFTIRSMILIRSSFPATKTSRPATRHAAH